MAVEDFGNGSGSTSNEGGGGGAANDPPRPRPEKLPPTSWTQRFDPQAPPHDGLQPDRTPAEESAGSSCSERRTSNLPNICAWFRGLVPAGLTNADDNNTTSSTDSRIGSDRRSSTQKCIADSFEIEFRDLRDDKTRRRQHGLWHRIFFGSLWGLFGVDCNNSNRNTNEPPLGPGYDLWGGRFDGVQYNPAVQQDQPGTSRQVEGRQNYLGFSLPEHREHDYLVLKRRHPLPIIGDPSAGDMPDPLGRLGFFAKIPAMFPSRSTSGANDLGFVAALCCRRWQRIVPNTIDDMNQLVEALTGLLRKDMPDHEGARPPSPKRGCASPVVSYSWPARLVALKILHEIVSASEEYRGQIGREVCRTLIELLGTNEDGVLMNCLAMETLKRIVIGAPPSILEMLVQEGIMPHLNRHIQCLGLRDLEDEYEARLLNSALICSNALSPSTDPFSLVKEHSIV